MEKVDEFDPDGLTDDEGPQRHLSNSQFAPQIRLASRHFLRHPVDWFGIDPFVVRGIQFTILCHGRMVVLMQSHKGAPMTEPINLMQRFGKRYRISFDPAYDPKHRPNDKLDAWMMQIPCQRGTIYPYGGNELAVMVDYRPITAKQLADLPGVQLVQHGDHEKTFIFAVELFDEVAKLVKPRRRRRLTPEQRENLKRAGEATRFSVRGTERSLDAPTGV